MKKALKIDNKNTKNTLKNDEKCAKNQEKNDEKSIIICEKNDENQSKLIDLQVENLDLNLSKKTKQSFENFKIFIKNTINLSVFENENFLIEKVCEALYYLSHSKVWEGNLMVGGVYHKNQYFFVKKGFLHEKSRVFCAKNVKIKHFGEFVKQNMCNFGLYFYVKKRRPFVKIFCGNGFLIEKTIQNYIEKFVQKSL